MDVKKKLVELLGGCPCESDCEGSVGSCPNRKNGNCNEVFKLSYCAVSKLAQHLIYNCVTVQELDGCEYCNDNKSVYYHGSGIHDSMDEDVYVSGNNLVVDIGCHSYGTAEIKFCPMCGRRLPQPPKGE